MIFISACDNCVVREKLFVELFYLMFKFMHTCVITGGLYCKINIINKEYDNLVVYLNS